MFVAVSASATPNPYGTSVVRCSAKFSPGFSTDQFLSYASMEADTKTHEHHLQELKKEVRTMLMSQIKKSSHKLDLIDDITRLGVSRFFEEEIDQILKEIYEDSYHENGLQYDEDLYSASLRFRLLRQQGYNISCDMFKKFINDDGKFKESHINDVGGLLSLYEATHLMKHGENILEEALIFTTTHLESAVPHTSSILSKQVTHALYQPFWKGLPRIEALHYLSIYQETDSHNETLLTLAKLDFNLLQKVHKKELSDLTRWWKDLDFENKLPFARDRLAESYFWASAVYFESEYELARIITCKFVAILTILDDIYDVYGTYAELELFTDAVERWDISAADRLPFYMRICYEALLNTYTEFEQKLANKGNLYRIHYAREALKDQVRAYFQEAKWFKQKYTPTMDEYMEVELKTSFLAFATTSFLGLGAIVTEDSMEWVFNDPKIVKAASVIGRLLNDMVGHKFEQKREHIASSVECYMNQYGVTEEEAKIELTKQVNFAWKDINEEWLQSSTSIPRPLLWLVLNLARSGEVLYKNVDLFTHPKTVLEDYLVSLFVEPLPV